MIKNLNSSINIDNKQVAQAISKMGFLIHRWNSVPVYLVSQDIIDCLYPKEKRKTYSEECLKKRWREHKNLDERLFSNPQEGEDWEKYHERRDEAAKRLPGELNRVWEDLEKCSSERTDEFVAAGLYCQAITSECLAQFDLPAGAAIFICPERIDRWSQNISHSTGFVTPCDSFDLIFQKVLFHELAHAYIQSSSMVYNTPHGRMIEESLANAVSYSRFQGQDRAAVVAAIGNQPLEYRGYTFWTESPDGPYAATITWKEFHDFKGRAWDVLNKNGFHLFTLEKFGFAFGSAYRNLDMLMENYWKWTSLRIIDHILG